MRGLSSIVCNTTSNLKFSGGARTFRVSPKWIEEQYGRKLSDRALYPDELRYIRRLLRIDKKRLPKATLYDAFQMILDRMGYKYSYDTLDFRNILREWEENTGIPLVIPRGYSYVTPERTVYDLTQPEVIDLTGGGRVKPHIVRPFFSMG